ncbi:hypothetical protein D3C81_1353450 [compost metagenome]
MSRAGAYALFATSIVGARMMNSADWRQFRISTVSMIAAAMVLFAFFLLMRRKNSWISRSPVLELYAPKMAPAKSLIHGAQDSPIKGLPGASTIRRSFRTCMHATASSGNSGGNGTSDCRLMIRDSQSGHAVSQVGSFTYFTDRK